MGLARISAADWLADAISPAERARKETLLDRWGTAVADGVPGYGALERGVVSEVASVLGVRRTFAGREPRMPTDLWQVSLWVPEDLCLLAPSAAGYRLVSASLCSPSYWRLQDKLGRLVHEVHAPVRGLNDAVGDYIARFLDRLPVGQVFQRRNWNIHRSFRRFHPLPEDWSEPLTPARCAKLCMRTETQTLRKFDNQGLLFTIRVDRFVLGDIAGYPGAARDLLAAVAAFSRDEREASVFGHHSEALIGYLRSVVAVR